MRKIIVTSALLLGVLFGTPVLALADVYNGAVEPAVKNYFDSDPVMVNIASCESQFHQFNTDGSVLHGGYKHTMIGIYQIAPLHIPDASSRGYDINTVAGNMAYAKYLYDTYGTSPWLDSMHCWGKMRTDPAPAVQAGKMQSETATAVASTDDMSTRLQNLKWQVARLEAALQALIADRSSDAQTT